MAQLSHDALGDILALTKPKITAMTVMVAAAGLMLADGDSSFMSSALALVGIAFLVSGSSSLNMFLERDLDKRMTRTKGRPLPSGRLAPWWAILVGFTCSLSACLLLWLYANALTLMLAIFAFVIYVFIYTPLKQKTWLALIVGSIPGAMPVALGYVSLSNSFDAKALALFSWAFLWQVPHFLAISIFRESEYTRAGFPVLPAVTSIKCAKIALLISAWLLVLSTIGLYLSHIITLTYLIGFLFFGVLFLMVCHQRAFANHISGTELWAKKAFKATLFYQSFIFLSLIVAAFY